MNALLELAERCEHASFPCPDDASATEIMAIKSAICRLITGRGYDAYSPDYTASLDAAMTLVPQDAHWEVGGCEGKHGASVSFDADKMPNATMAATPALALCAAALKARAEQVSA